MKFYQLIFNTYFYFPKTEYYGTDKNSKLKPN